MKSPPLKTPAADRADYSRNTLDYSDPTGDTAIRNLLNGGGPFQITAESGIRIFVNRESLEYMMLGMKARASRNGKLWLDPELPQKTETPTATNANQSRGEGQPNS